MKRKVKLLQSSFSLTMLKILLQFSNYRNSAIYTIYWCRAGSGREATDSVSSVSPPSGQSRVEKVVGDP